MAETRLRTKKEAQHLEHRDKIYYNKRYDAYACRKCNVWLEKRCRDRECEFCADRPRKPNKK